MKKSFTIKSCQYQMIFFEQIKQELIFFWGRFELVGVKESKTCEEKKWKRGESLLIVKS
jgi:hypothetical protein